jgi:hypothetical protein
MANLLVSAYFGRYPLGGALSWNLQWLAGLHRLGQRVVILEGGGYSDA